MSRRYVLSWIGLVALLAARASGQEPTLIVENGRVIVGDGTVLEGASVVVAGERILEVTDGPVEAPDARRIDASGKTVLPGLVDAHVHLLVEPGSSMPRSEGDLNVYLREELPARLRAYLEAGITPVVSTGDFWPAIRPVREQLQSVGLRGPRVFTSGPVFTAPGGHPAVTVCGRPDGERSNPWCREHLAREVDSRREARAALERLAREGVDFVKMVYDTVSPPDVEQLETALLQEIVAAAHGHGLRADGQRATLVQAMDAKGVTAATTLVVAESLRDRFASEGRAEPAEWFSGNLKARLETIRRMAEADERLVVLGTDTPWLPPGGAFHREVRLLGRAGLTPEQIIRAATGNAAEHLGRDEDLGTLEAGKLADLIVVDGNPLEDVSALRQVEVVVKDGEAVVDDRGRRSRAFR